MKETLPGIKDREILDRILNVILLSTKRALEKIKAHSGDDRKPLKKAIYAFKQFEHSFIEVLNYIGDVNGINYGSLGPLRVKKFMETFGVDSEKKNLVLRMLEISKCFTECTLVRMKLRIEKANGALGMLNVPERVWELQKSALQEIDAVLNAQL